MSILIETTVKYFILNFYRQLKWERSIQYLEKLSENPCEFIFVLSKFKVSVFRSNY